jgi:hypothetical protein
MFVLCRQSQIATHAKPNVVDLFCAAFVEADDMRARGPNSQSKHSGPPILVQVRVHVISEHCQPVLLQQQHLPLIIYRPTLEPAEKALAEKQATFYIGNAASHVLQNLVPHLEASYPEGL